jgi:hypothetical protein
MSSRERVTWETCPRCGLSAAVGWREGALVAVDCPGGCRMTAADCTRRKPKGLRFPAPGRALRDRGWGRAGGGRSDPVPVAVGSVTVPVTRCRQCASPQVGHLWRADMAHLNLIDQWKCLDIRCGHRWDTTVTYAQLQDADLSRSGPADDDAIPVGRQESDAMSDSG